MSFSSNLTLTSDWCGAQPVVQDCVFSKDGFLAAAHGRAVDHFCNEVCCKMADCCVSKFKHS